MQGQVLHYLNGSNLYNIKCALDQSLETSFSFFFSFFLSFQSISLDRNLILVFNFFFSWIDLIFKFQFLFNLVRLKKPLLTFHKIFKSLFSIFKKVSQKRLIFNFDILEILKLFFIQRQLFFLLKKIVVFASIEIETIS